MKGKKRDTPSTPCTELSVSLYPRSAAVLLDLLDKETLPESKLKGHPGYVVVDIANFRNLLAAHLQRVALGENSSNSDLLS